MSAPLISVVIAAFDAAQTLAESLASVRAQTFGDFEVIVVDDGSTDATAEIARRFGAQDARFITINQPNGGPSVARNTGIRRACGEWIAFQDADDVWLAEKLARQVEVLQVHPQANFIFTNLFFWEDGRDLYPAYDARKPLPEGDPMRRLIFADDYLTPSVMVKSAALAAAGPFDPELRLSQDWDMWLRLGENGLHARGVREPMVRYRRWPGSRTSARLAVAEANVRMLEKNLARTRREDYRKLYRRSLANARAVRELVRPYAAQETNSAALAAATLRAWKCEPRLKWLRWYLLLAWPALLGGNATRRSIQQKFIHKCRGY